VSLLIANVENILGLYSFWSIVLRRIHSFSVIPALSTRFSLRRLRRERFVAHARECLRVTRSARAHLCDVLCVRPLRAREARGVMSSNALLTARVEAAQPATTEQLAAT